MKSESTARQSALRTIEIERKAISALSERINDDFVHACDIILSCTGRTVVIGIGKSGHIAKKIAATMASTGSPAQFVHAAEASHGDIGMITDSDVVLAISNSGNTEEITSLLPVLKRKNVPIITLTGDPDSPLATSATVNLDASVDEEACPLGLAPTSSTTAALVFGDALAMALLEAKGFTRDDFAISHPGGNLGRRLLVKVQDVMHTGADIPRVGTGTVLADALIEMSSKGFGMTTVVNDGGEVCGVFTDGDLRRALDAGCDLKSTLIEEVMSKGFKYVQSNALAAEAALLMQESNVYVLMVMSADNKLEGILKMHDLLQANVV